MFFVWDDAYNTGIEVIDIQHRRIVDYINDLHHAISSDNKEGVEEVLGNLISYTISHFSFEESLMEEHGYQHTEGHRKVHKAFTDRVMRYQLEWSSGKDISRRLLSDLKVWLISHIQQEDQDYAKEISKKLNKGWVSKMLGRFFN
jgi:hemerythrin